MVFTVGLFPAALRALGVASKMLRVRALGCFVFCFQSLSEDLCPAAVGLLVENNVVELTVQEMAEGGANMEGMGTSILLHSINDPRARQRMHAPEVIDRLMQWIGKWILTVRHMGGQIENSDEDHREVCSGVSMMLLHCLLIPLLRQSQWSSQWFVSALAELLGKVCCLSGLCRC
jgi:hypothetical protein